MLSWAINLPINVKMRSILCVLLKVNLYFYKAAFILVFHQNSSNPEDGQLITWPKRSLLIKHKYASYFYIFIIIYNHSIIL